MLLQASQSCSRPPCAPYARADQISHPCPPSQSLDKILGFFRDSGLGQLVLPSQSLDKILGFFRDSGLGQLVLPWPAHGRHQKSAQRNQSQFRPDGIENPVRHTKGHISRPCPRLTKSDIFFWARGLGNWCAPRPARGRHQQSSAQRQQSQYRPDRIENPVRRTKGHISRPCPPSRLTKSDDFFWAQGLGNWCCPPSRLTKSDDFSGLGAWATGVHLGQLVVVINNRRNVNSLSIDRIALRTLCAIRKSTSVALCAIRKSTVAPCPAIRLTKSEDFVGARGLGVPLPALTAHQQSTQRPQFRWRQGQHMLGVDATPGAPRRP